MPSMFPTAGHCVSHLMLHSACVMRMSYGAGLSMCGRTQNTNDKHDLSSTASSTSYDDIVNGTARIPCS